MMASRVFAVFTMAMSLAAGALTDGALAADAGKPDPVKGRALYLANGCSYCHGTVGQGGGGRTGGLRLAQMGIGYEAFLNQLRHPVNEMPPYAQSAMPDSDVANIHAYIASLPPPPDVKSIPALNR
ncbi:MAG TPA: c-type cytochrome [Micropepsaceae bacterium]|jgi:mono/diheme cytochrome c family protein